MTQQIQNSDKFKINFAIKLECTNCKATFIRAFSLVVTLISIILKLTGKI